MHNRLANILTLAALLAGPILAGDSEKKIKMRDLPPAVQQAVREQTQTATLRGLSTEVENGRTLYEAELRVNGHSKDVTFDAQGKLVSVEEEVALDSLPPAAREAILKSVGKGKLRKLETVTENGVTFYEALVRKGLKSSEIKVDSSGRTVK
jgi:uncharacterized membrane protein YkoI